MGFGREVSHSDEASNTSDPSSEPESIHCGFSKRPPQVSVKPRVERFKYYEIELGLRHLEIWIIKSFILSQKSFEGETRSGLIKNTSLDDLTFDTHSL